MPKLSKNKPSTPKPEPPSLEVLAARIKEYEEATRAYETAARLALESNEIRSRLGLSSVAWRVAGKDKAVELADLEGQVYDGADAIAEFAAALKAGGGSSAQFFKLSGAAIQLALYAFDLRELMKL